MYIATPATNSGAIAARPAPRQPSVGQELSALELEPAITAVRELREDGLRGSRRELHEVLR